MQTKPISPDQLSTIQYQVNTEKMRWYALLTRFYNSDDEVWEITLEDEDGISNLRNLQSALTVTIRRLYPALMHVRKNREVLYLVKGPRYPSDGFPR